MTARAEGGQCGPAPQNQAVRETGEGLSHAFPSGARHKGPQPKDPTPRTKPLALSAVPLFTVPLSRSWVSALQPSGWFKARICYHKFYRVHSLGEGEGQILDGPIWHQDSTHAHKDAFTTVCRDRLPSHPIPDQIVTSPNLHLLPLLWISGLGCDGFATG